MLLSTQVAGSSITLTWSEDHASDPNIVGYSVYYDQGGKHQVVAQLGPVTTYVDRDLTPGQRYSYQVSSHTVNCESGLSNPLFADAVWPYRLWLPTAFR